MSDTNKIRILNDAFRQTFIGGRVMMTPGVLALASDQLKQLALLDAVRTFDTLGHSNDPHHEHDFGSLVFDGAKVFWKIDYYDKTRVLTIMLASEY